MVLFYILYFFTTHVVKCLVKESMGRIWEDLITPWSKWLEVHYKIYHGGSCPKWLNEPEGKSCCRPGLCPHCSSLFLSHEKSFCSGLELNPRAVWNKAIRITKWTQPLLKIKTIAGFPRKELFYRQTQYQIKPIIPWRLPSLVYI